MTDDGPPDIWSEAKNPADIAAAVDEIIQSLLATGPEDAATRLLADAYRRAVERRSLGCVEAQEQAMLMLIAALKAAKGMRGNPDRGTE